VSKQHAIAVSKSTARHLVEEHPRCYAQIDPFRGIEPDDTVDFVCVADLRTVHRGRVERLADGSGEWAGWFVLHMVPLPTEPDEAERWARRLHELGEYPTKWDEMAYDNRRRAVANMGRLLKEMKCES
jgi:hypothetical protein